MDEVGSIRFLLGNFQLAEVVKLGATSLGADDGEAQVMLINSVKDVALALNHLINVTKSASGKSIDDPEMQKLKESAKIMVTNVTALLRTVKSVEDEAQRGTNALEATIESIAQELRLFNNGQPPLTKTTPEELIRVTKQVRRDTNDDCSEVHLIISIRLLSPRQKQWPLVNRADKKISSLQPIWVANLLLISSSSVKPVSTQRKIKLWNNERWTRADCVSNTIKSCWKRFTS